MPVGVKVPTTVPSTCTWKVCELLCQLPRCAASKLSVYVPASSDAVWLKLPAACRKAICAPSGALGLPEVKPLLLPATPVRPVKVHAEPLGLY